MTNGDGNITSENTWTYVYDLSNQLIRVLEGTNQIAEYVYNGAGQRIKKVTPTEARIFHYDQFGHIIAETNQTGQMIAEYVYLGDQLLCMIKPGESVYYFRNDHLGTPQVLTNEGQSISWKAAYTPFGQAAISVATTENPFRFPGQYYDQETGLHYNYFRYYDPTTGRYITPDPIGLEGGINLFAYVANNPIKWVDPMGLSTLTYDRQSGTLTLYTAGGTQVGQFPAGNTTTSNSDPWPAGTFSYSHYMPHPESGATGPYGSYGNFVFNVPDRTGMGVHSGRQGPQSPTEGCIRTTDEGTRTIGELHFFDPLTSITVR